MAPLRLPLGTPLATQAAHVSLNYAAVGVTAPRMVKGKTPVGVRHPLAHNPHALSRCLKPVAGCD
jgi:hypothetical protein